MDPEIGMLLSAAEQRELAEDELVRLLGCPEDSPEASAIISHAHSLALSAQEGIGEIGAQIGIATGPCHADCAFCAFAFSTTDADDYVMPEDVKALAPAVLAHRIVMAVGGKMSESEALIGELCAACPVPLEKAR